jgi:ABC-2 type transport system permease protein
MTHAIQTEGLAKSFGRTRALDGVDLSVAPGAVHGFLWASLAHVPAALVVAAFVVAAVTFVPRWAAALGWGALAVSLVLGQLGAQFELPQAVLNLSPFTHVPPAPAGSIAALPLVVLSAVAVALVGVAALRFQQRDLVLAV